MTSAAKVSMRGPGARSFLLSILGDRRKRLLGAFVLFLLLTILWNLPIAVDPAHTVLRGPADGTLTIRGNWATEAAGKNPFTATRDNLNGAPEGIPYFNAVTWTAPVQGGVVLLLHYLFGWIAAWNLFLMLGFLLTGFLAFVLLDELGFHPLASLFGGYVLAFNPWMFERAWAGHAAFVHPWVFVLLLLTLLRMSRARSFASALIAGCAYGLTFLYAAYFGLLATVLVLAYFVYELIRVRGWAERLWTFSLSCGVFAGPIVFLSPGLVRYAADHHAISTSLSNATLEAQRLGADTLAYLMPDRGHPVLGALTRSYGESHNFSEGTLFFGWTTIVLALIGAVLVARKDAWTTTHPTRRRATVFAVVLVPLAYWASLKSVVHPLGVPVPTLSWFATHVTTYFRVYARFGILVGLGLVILAALTLDRIVRRSTRGPAIAIALLVVVAFELIPGRVTGWAATSPPVYDRWLATQPQGIVAHYPLPTDQSAAIHLGEREIYFQMFSKKPLFNIFGPGTGNTREDAIRILGRYVTDPLTPSILAAEHVRYVVLHDDVYREEKVTPPAAPKELRLIKRFPDTRVYVLRSGTPPTDLDAVLEQNAVQIGLVQGLAAPRLIYESGFSSPGSNATQRTLHGIAELTLDNRDVNLKRVQIVLVAKGRSGPQLVTVTDAAGATLGNWTFGMQATQVTLGPFSIGQGRTTLKFAVSGGGTISIEPPLVQPLADYSVSLRAS